MISEYVDPIIKLGFPTVLALLFITWFFYKYLPTQQKNQEQFQAEQQKSHEKVVGVMASAFKEALERIVAHNTALHDSHTSKIDSMKSTVEGMRADVRELVAAQLNDNDDHPPPERRTRTGRIRKV